MNSPSATDEVAILVNVLLDGSVSGVDDENEQLLREASWASGYCLAINKTSGFELDIRYLGGRWIAL